MIAGIVHAERDPASPVLIVAPYRATPPRIHPPKRGFAAAVQDRMRGVLARREPRGIAIRKNGRAP